MLLTITYSGENTTDLGYLLYKNPNRPQEFELTYGKAYVFYPEVSNEKTTCALLLQMDPLDLARGKLGSSTGGLFDYVNDRPYVTSSFMSNAIAKVFGTAMTGRGDDHQYLADSKLDLTACITMLPFKGDLSMVNRVFEPLGYEVCYETFQLDEVFPEWGISKYINLTIKAKVLLKDLLNHIYILIPVFDKQKHYYSSKDEVDKLFRHSETWLKDHPEKTYITSRYLNISKSLMNAAFEKLYSYNEDIFTKKTQNTHPKLNTARLNKVLETVKDCGATSVIDMGCGDGKLLTLLLKENQFKKIAAVDVSFETLKKTMLRLKMDEMSDSTKMRIQLFQGSLTYKDSRFEGYDAACIVEVIEHLDLSRLNAFERVVFEFAKPKTVIITTPNKEYNKNYENLEEGKLRHHDHRFEFTRNEFKNWAEKVSNKYNYRVKFMIIGHEDESLGSETQMGVFTLCV